jgi:hypothetical protein
MINIKIDAVFPSNVRTTKISVLNMYFLVINVVRFFLSGSRLKEMLRELRSSLFFV